MTTFGLLKDPAHEGSVQLPVGPETGITWPRLLNLDQDTERRLTMWLYEEIGEARREKQALLDDWKKWQKQYWAKPKTEVRNWPFERAANIVIPITAISVEAVFARLMNTLFAVEPFYSIRPKSNAWIPAAPKVEEWLQTEIENPNLINMYGFCEDSLLECVKLGTGVGKSGYVRDVRKTYQHLGDEDIPVWVEVRNGAALDYVPIANFLIRLSEQDPQTAGWVGEEHSFTWAQLKRMVLSGQYDRDAVEEIKHRWTSTGSEDGGTAEDYHDEVDSISKQEPNWNAKFNIQEIWCSFDVDGDGVDEEIVVDYHHSSQTIVAVRYNWYSDLHRPYRGVNYFPVEGRFFGIGVGKQNEQFQEEVTTIHRQRLDNATLANMGMVALKKNSGYGPDEPIFPGKMWFLDDPQADIAPFKLSEVYASAFNNEQVTMSYQEKRVGVNEVILGQPHVGTPGTATGDTLRLAEGNKRFDLVLKGVRRWLSQLGIDLLANYQQFGDQQRHFTTLGPDGVLVEQVLQLPPELVRDGAIVEVTATDSVTNRDSEQRAWMAGLQILEKYYMGQFQIAQALGDPNIIMQLAVQSMRASTEAVRRLLSTFDVKDIEKLLIDPEQLLGGANGASPGGPPNGGPVGLLPPNPGQGGVAGLGSPAQGNGGQPTEGSIPRF